MRRVSTVLGLALAAIACAERPKAEATNPEQVALGNRVYFAQCVSCHGAKLEGSPTGASACRAVNFLPAARPQWSHVASLRRAALRHRKERHRAARASGLSKRYAGVRRRLSDAEIWAVLAYIRSTWPEETRKLQAGVSGEDAKTRR